MWLSTPLLVHSPYRTYALPKNASIFEIFVNFVNFVRFVVQKEHLSIDGTNT
jgi:hypothetical protein